MATIPAETVARYLVATVLGLIMGLGEFFGGCVAPTLAGLAADEWGLQVVLWIAFTCAICAAILSLFLKETAPAIVGKQN